MHAAGLLAVAAGMGHTVHVNCIGRLGNQLFQAHSAAGIALKNNMGLCVTWCNSLNDHFENVAPPCSEPRPPHEVSENGQYATFHDWKLKKSTAVSKYLQSFRYFPPRSIRFKPAVQLAARTFVERTAFQNVTVGIHVRHGDLIGLRYVRFPPESYFVAVLARFRARFKDPVFIVASDEPEWCLRQPFFRSADVAIIKEPHFPAMDMAILAECDHIALTAGTFGWWAAYLGAHRAGGDVVYYADEFDMDHPTNQGNVVTTDYYPENWVALKSPNHDPGRRRLPLATTETHWASSISSCMKHLQHKSFETSISKFFSENGQEKKLYEAPEKFQADATVIELGAYSGRDIGVFFQKASRRNVQTKNMSFYLYEPADGPYKTIQATYERQENVHTLKSGASNHSGNLCVTGSGDALALMPGMECNQRLQIQDVAEILAPHERVDLLHINCEGCEVPIIQRALATSKNVNAIEVQFHPQHISTEDYCSVAANLYASGYRLSYQYVWVWELWVKTTPRAPTTSTASGILASMIARPL